MTSSFSLANILALIFLDFSQFPSVYLIVDTYMNRIHHSNERYHMEIPESRVALAKRLILFEAKIWYSFIFSFFRYESELKTPS